MVLVRAGRVKDLPGVKYKVCGQLGEGEGTARGDGMGAGGGGAGQEMGEEGSAGDGAQDAATGPAKYCMGIVEHSAPHPIILPPSHLFQVIRGRYDCGGIGDGRRSPSTGHC